MMAFADFLSHFLGYVVEEKDMVQGKAARGKIRLCRRCSPQSPPVKSQMP
jgi:hypothetical protein